MWMPLPNPARVAEYRAAGYWRDDTIPGLIGEAGRRAPEKIAVRDASGEQLTYSELASQSDRLAGFLAAHGVNKGDIVTVCLPNWCATVVVFLAIMKRGAIVNPVPVTYGRADISYVLTKCASRALVIPGKFRSADFTAVLSEMDPDLLKGRTVIRIGEGAHDIGCPWADALSHEPVPAPTITADDPAAVLFTSGTESRSKGAVHTHNTILFGERALANALQITADDIAFMASPISHTTGYMHGVVMTLTLGGTLSLLDVFEGGRAAAQLGAHRCTWTMGATPFLADIANALEQSGNRLPDLRYFMCGGAPIPESLVLKASDVGLRVMSIYGATESPPHTVVHPNDPPENAWSTDGRALEGIEVRIISPDGAVLPVGEIGEECSRGPNTFLGYLDEPELTAKDLAADGWYRSGDLARMLPDGSIRIAGRLKDIIVRGGQNISVREVEDYLAAHPAIHSAAIVGVPHARLGEMACAVVVTRPGRSVSLPDLTDFLLAKGVARFKLPERLEVWPSLPTNPSGKIQKFIIRKALVEDGGRSPS